MRPYIRFSPGDTSLAELYQRHAHTLLAFIRRSVHTREDAEDILPLLWSRSIDVVERIGNINLFTLENGLIYRLAMNNNILAFQAATGAPAQGYHPAVAALGSFIFVP